MGVYELRAPEAATVYRHIGNLAPEIRVRLEHLDLIGAIHTLNRDFVGQREVFVGWQAP